MEFTVAGAPRDLAQAIEQHASGQNGVTAIVVPWESDPVTVRMAITAVKIDGWAIEHTNLGTISLTGLGHDATRVAVEPHDSGHSSHSSHSTPPDRQKLAALFDRFARQIQSRFQVTS